MTITPTTLLALPIITTGTESGLWGDEVNNGLTQYLDVSIAGTQTISGSQTAVTLSLTAGTSSVTNLAQAGAGATGSAQYQIINCTGNPASLLTITVPASSKTYIIINATTTSQSVKIVGAGPTSGVTVASGQRALVAWNGSDFVQVGASAGGSTTQVQFNSSGALAGSSSLTWDGTSLSASNFVATATTSGSSNKGAYSYGTLGYSDVNHILTMQASQNNYIQMEIQNTSSGASASADVVVGNSNTTASTYYGDFGMNSSGFSGTGALGAANNVYLTSTTADLAIGTTTSNPIHFVIGGSATDAMTINTSGAIAVNGSYGTAGYYLQTNGSGSAPTWTAVNSASSTYTRTSFTATASQTTFTVTYTVGYVAVYLNGVLLNGADYTATNGTSIVLAVGANSGDIVETIAYSINAVGTINASNITGILAIANGGTGATTLSGANIPTTNASNTFTATQIFNGSSSTFATTLLDANETVNVVAAAPSATTNFYIQSGGVQYYTSNAANNWTLNIAFSSGTSLNTALSTGQSVTFTLITTQGSTAYYNNAVTIDGTSVTPKWIGGAPTAGNASGLDVYRFAVVKTASATYTVLASLTQYK